MDEQSDFTDAALDSWTLLRPHHDKATFEVAMRVTRLAVVINDRLNAVAAEHGFSIFGDYEVVAAIRRSDRPLQPSTIAESLMLTRAGITGRLNRLHGQGLIEREHAISDARGVLVSVTEHGRRTVDEAFAAMEDERMSLLKTLKRSEQSQLASLLRKVLAPLDVAAEVLAGD